MSDISSRSYRFSHAVSRTPGNSIANGLRAMDGPNPDWKVFQKEHDEYVNALKSTNINLTLLPALEAFPDSVFVEDPALCAGGKAIILRPGTPTRLGEADAIKPALEKIFGSVSQLKNGYVDGGDILLTDSQALIGLSERTDKIGIKLLEPFLSDLGYSIKIVNTPKGVLHFKTDCGLLDSNTIFSTELLASSGCFDGYKVITAPSGEEAAANLIRFNDHVFMRSGFPKTKALLENSGYSVKTLDANEAAKVDGGLSCMSLRFSL